MTLHEKWKQEDDIRILLKESENAFEKLKEYLNFNKTSYIFRPYVIDKNGEVIHYMEIEDKDLKPWILKEKKIWIKKFG